MNNWMTLADVSRHLKVSEPSLYKLVQNGEIPAVKLGRQWRFEQTQIDNWLLTQQAPRKTKHYPWQDCADHFSDTLKQEFGDSLISIWLYGSWARGEAQGDSDIDLLIVIEDIKDLQQVRSKVSALAYEATYGRDRAVLFSTTVTDKINFLTGKDPLLLNVRLEGKRLDIPS